MLEKTELRLRNAFSKKRPSSYGSTARSVLLGFPKHCATTPLAIRAAEFKRPAAIALRKLLP